MAIWYIYCHLGIFSLFWFAEPRKIRQSMSYKLPNYFRTFAPKTLYAYDVKYVNFEAVQNCQSGADFSYTFSGKNFWKNSAEIFFPCKIMGKIGIFRGKKSFKSFSLEIPRKIQRKVIFRGKNVRKIDYW
jgi:hypothetical protein